jgi:hypothetical protein
MNHERFAVQLSKTIDAGSALSMAFFIDGKTPGRLPELCRDFPPIQLPHNGPDQRDWSRKNVA